MVGAGTVEALADEPGEAGGGAADDGGADDVAAAAEVADGDGAAGLALRESLAEASADTAPDSEADELDESVPVHPAVRQARQSRAIATKGDMWGRYTITAL
jgi:hypothetical protein